MLRVLNLGGLLLMSGLLTGHAFGQETSNTAVSTNGSQSLIERAQRQYAAGEADRSADTLRLYLDDQPGDDDARVQYARSLAAAKRFHEARAECEQVLQRHPDSPDALLVRGLIELWQKHFEAARPYLEKVVEKSPGYCDAYVALSNTYWWQGRRDEARAVLDRAESRCTSNSAFLQQIRLVQESASATGTSEEAVNLNADAKRDAPPRKEVAADDQRFDVDYDALIRQARELLNAEQVCEADALLDRILHEKPGYPDAMLLKGQAALRRQAFQVALDWFSAIVRSTPDYCDAYYGMSNALIGLKELDDACRVLSSNTKCQESAEYVAQLARVENARGNYARAKDLFLQAHEMEPSNPDFEEGYRTTRLFTNTSLAQYESFRLTGSQFYFSNQLRYQPSSCVSYDLVTEYFHRFHSSTERLGGGVLLHPCEDLWMHGQLLQSLNEELVPSRYDADMAYRILRDPDTSLLAGSTYFKSENSRTLVNYLGARQQLGCESPWFAEYRRNFAHPLTDGSATHSDVLRLTYEKEKERIVTLGLARGGEAFSEETGAAGLATGSYRMNSTFATWKEWVCEDWGWIANVSKTQRSNGNDSAAIGAGVFFEF
jgi:tetratricopeptide (TPR) repeat protein